MLAHAFRMRAKAGLLFFMLKNPHGDVLFPVTGEQCVNREKKAGNSKQEIENAKWRSEISKTAGDY